ncbi:MAG: hypoxanthine phosphoribosyltransferase [Acholeplasmatales bacterium]|nr:hypoxanthine phosphoribosyltransferase [Acholeplasmatales bacterium]
MSYDLNDDIEKIFVTEDQIKEITKRVGTAINKDYADKDPLFIGLLKGCLPFMSDLLKYVDIKCSVDYLKCSSYSGTHSLGTITVKGDVPVVEGRHVIVVDDILDSGRTISAVKNLFMQNGAKSVAFCVFLDKPEGRVVDITPSYVGGLVPNEFVVGYGLDYEEHYRNLPYVGVLKEEIYTK